MSREIKKVQEFKLNPEIAVAFVQCFDNAQGKRVIEYLENNVKARFPNYENVNHHYALTGQLQFVDSIKMFTRLAKKQIEKETKGEKS